MKLRRYVIAFFSVLIMACTTGCAVQDENNLGLYSCAEVSLDGELFEINSLYPSGCTLELNKWGQAWLNMDGDSFYGRWTVEGERFTLDIGGEVSQGSLYDGLCVISFKNSALEHIFLREGARLPEKAETVIQEQPLTEQQIFWNGDWYGVWHIKNAQGQWLDQSGQSFDCFARFYIETDGTGSMVFWDELQSYHEPIGEIELLISESELNKSAGIAVSTGGFFLNSKLGETQWSVDPNGYLYDSSFFIENAHYEGDDGSFDYSILLRPWGRTWEDVEAQQVQLLPYFYYDWYLPTLSAGGSMPDEFNFKKDTVIRDTWIDPTEETVE